MKTRTPNRTAEGHARGLSSVGAGVLRTRWTRYNVQIVNGQQVPVNLNCWRATVLFITDTTVTWDGIPMQEVFIGSGGTFDGVVKIVVGGAYYDQRPVYLNEVHFLTSPSGARFDVLVVEEYFDGAARPNN